jgi:lambda repressor-like predicted transcriptional regulator
MVTNNRVMNSLPNGLKHLIELLNFRSVRAAARNLGIPRTTLQMVINRYKASRTTLQLISFAWNVEPDWLEFGRGPIFKDVSDHIVPSRPALETNSGKVNIIKVPIQPFDSFSSRIVMAKAVLRIESNYQLAKLAKMDLDTLSLALDNEYLNEETAKILGKALGVEPEWLKEGKGHIGKTEVERALRTEHSETVGQLSIEAENIVNSREIEFVLIPKAQTRLAKGGKIVLHKGTESIN